jgi:hypothetical protein
MSRADTQHKFEIKYFSYRCPWTFQGHIFYTVALHALPSLFPKKTKMLNASETSSSASNAKKILFEKDRYSYEGESSVATTLAPPVSFSFFSQSALGLPLKPKPSHLLANPSGQATPPTIVLSLPYLSTMPLKPKPSHLLANPSGRATPPALVPSLSDPSTMPLPSALLVYPSERATPPALGPSLSYPSTMSLKPKPSHLLANNTIEIIRDVALWRRSTQKEVYAAVLNKQSPKLYETSRFAFGRPRRKSTLQYSTSTPQNYTRHRALASGDPIKTSLQSCP